MSKKKQQKDAYFKDNQGIASIKNQINQSFQSGVIEDKLENNKEVYTYNNQSK